MRAAIILITMIISSQIWAVRIKDMASVRGVRENQLIGYGLVVGLAGTGDSKSPYTNKSLAQMFRRMGVDVSADEIKSKNVAAAIVTATLPPFPRVGNKVDITVSSVGDAKSLEGGTLLLSPLRAGDQNVYAVAQGALSVGGFGKEASKTKYRKNHLSVARIPNGATIEREIDYNFMNKSSFRLAMHNPDFTTAARLVQTINKDMGGKYAVALDAGTIKVIVPYGYDGDLVQLLARIESLDVVPDTKAQVIINERTGTIVMGDKVRISTVAIAHGALSIEIKEETKSDNMGNKVTNQTMTVTEGSDDEKEKNELMVLKPGVTIKQVVKTLNTIGVTPRDLISILQAIKAAGALQAELKIM